MVVGTKIEATIDGGTETQNNYKVAYTLGLKGTNETQTDVKWYLFKSGSGQTLSRR